MWFKRLRDFLFLNTIMENNIFDFKDIDTEAEREALVLTHPYHAMDSFDETPYADFIQDNGDSFDVYFVGSTTPYEDPRNPNFTEHRIDLPEGYLEGLYDGAVRESEDGYPGNISTEDARDLLEENDRILFGGESLFSCLRRTYNDFVDERTEIEADTELGFLEDISFAPVMTPEGHEDMDSLREIREDDLPLLNDDITGVDFNGSTVNAFRKVQRKDEYRPETVKTAQQSKT